MYSSFEQAKQHVNADDHDQYLFPDKEIRSLMSIEQVSDGKWQIVVDVTTTCTEDLWPEHTRQGYKVRVKRVESLGRSNVSRSTLENYARTIIVRGSYTWALSTEIKDALVYVTVYRGGNECKEPTEWSELTPGIARCRFVPFSHLLSSTRNVKFVSSAPADSEEQRLYEETFLDLGFMPHMAEVKFDPSPLEHPTYEAARDHARKVKDHAKITEDKKMVGFVTAVRNSATKRYFPMLALYGSSTASQDLVDLATGCIVRVKPLSPMILRFVNKFTAPEDRIFYNAHSSSQ
jgi:hypothetical protein